MVVKPLLTLLCAPYLDAILDEPLDDKWRLIRNPSNSVKHEHQQDIKFSLLGVVLNGLEFITVFCPNLMARYAVLLLLMNNGPAFFFRKAMTGFTLHGDICLTLIVIVHLLIGGYTI